MVDISRVVESVKNGDRLSLARLITQVENNTPEGLAALDALFKQAGHAHLVGITGAPGTGKSSLLSHIVLSFRHPPTGTPIRRVGIVAVDPSSPFSGGALLGDRVRMRDLSGDKGVFIRSMASRGVLGGLARATSGVVQVLDAAGFDLIFIETVGAGQVEVDITRLAHTTIVVESPGLGDDIQAIKAGILEIADILVVNKADLPGVENTERALRGMLDLVNVDKEIMPQKGWVVPLMKTVSIQGIGVSELVEKIILHEDYLKQSGELNGREEERLRYELDNLIQETLVNRWRSRVSRMQYQEITSMFYSRKITPQEALNQLMEI